MRRRARRFCGILLVSAFSIGAAAAVAQELQVDPKALDTSGASSSVQTRRKGRKGVDAAAQQPAGKPAANAAGPNRQFGELEGWSPGKAPPKPRGKYDPEPSSSSSTTTSSSSNKAPVNVTPSGNMSVGLPF